MVFLGGLVFRDFNQVAFECCLWVWGNFSWVGLVWFSASRMHGEATLTLVGRCPSEGGPHLSHLRTPPWLGVALYQGPALLFGAVVWISQGSQLCCVHDYVVGFWGTRELH